jgi:hypothetical protein
MQLRGLSILLIALVLSLLVYARPWKSGQSYRGRIRKVLEELGYSKNLDLIYSIARHETGNFTSRVFKECQNAFGLKTYQMTKCMAPAAEGSGLFYQEFETLEDSVRGFIRWLEKRGIRPGASDDEIKNVMQKGGYFTDPQYFRKIERWMKRI